MMMLGCRKLEMLVISMITFGIMNLSISIIFITRTGGYEDDTSNFTIMIPSKVQDVIKHTLKWAIEEPSLSNLPSCIKDDVLCRYDDVGDFLESAVNPAIVGNHYRVFHPNEEFHMRKLMIGLTSLHNVMQHQRMAQLLRLWITI